MIIPETVLKIKRPLRLFMEGSLIILVLGLVFTLGRISTLSASQPKEPLEIVYPPLVRTDIPTFGTREASFEPEKWAFAASKTGKSYYPKGCKSLDRIKPENRVYFDSEKEARDAGLTQSSACN